MGVQIKIRRDGTLETQPVNVLSSIQKEVYDIGDTVIYVGTAPLGTATSAAAWLIKKVTLSGGNPTLTQWSSNNAVWDDRASISYS